MRIHMGSALNMIWVLVQKEQGDWGGRQRPPLIGPVMQDAAIVDEDFEDSLLEVIRVHV